MAANDEFRSTFSTTTRGMKEIVHDVQLRQSYVKDGHGTISFLRMEFPLPPDSHPFDFGYCPERVVYLVTAACLAYQCEAKVLDVTLQLWGMKHAKFFSDEETDTQCFAACNDDIILISFRGTTTMTDWGVNVSATQVPLNNTAQYSGCYVHEGFHSALMTVLPQLEAWMHDVGGRKENPNKKLYICGHSLGGALASVCYAHFILRADPIPVHSVVTIGQPRVGDSTLVRTIERKGTCKLQRIVNANDIVPLVPPSVAGYGYCHYGNTVYFSPSGQIHWSIPIVLQTIDSTQAYVTGTTGVESHMKDQYLKLVKTFSDQQAKKRAFCAVYRAVVTVHKAQNLPQSDSLGSSDAFPELNFNEFCLRGPVVNSSLNPEWEHQFVIPEIAENESFCLRVWDEDSMGDDFLGQATIVFESPMGTKKSEITLRPQGGTKNEIRGTLTYSVEYFLTRKAKEVPSAKCKLTLHCARDIKAGDYGGTSDPYARIKCGTTEKVTPVISKTLNPDWNYQCEIPSVLANETMYVDIYDQDITRSEFLGRATVTFEDEFKNASKIEFPLELKDSGQIVENISGSIFMSFEFEERQKKNFKNAVGTVTIHSARNLAIADITGSSDPLVTVEVGVPPDFQRFKTKTIKKNLNPKWEETFKISSIPTGTHIRMRVWDRDLLTKDFLGQMELKFGTFYDIEKEWYTLFQSKEYRRAKVSGDICLSFHWEEA